MKNELVVVEYSAPSDETVKMSIYQDEIFIEVGKEDHDGDIPDPRKEFGVGYNEVDGTKVVVLDGIVLSSYMRKLLIDFLSI